MGPREHKRRVLRPQAMIIIFDTVEATVVVSSCHRCCPLSKVCIIKLSLEGKFGQTHAEIVLGRSNFGMKISSLIRMAVFAAVFALSRPTRALLLVLLARPTHELQLQLPTTRRAVVASTANLVLCPAAAFAKKKKEPEVPKCYDAKFNEIPCQSTAIGDGSLAVKTEDLPQAWREGGGAPVANPTMVTERRSDGQEVAPGGGNRNAPLRTYIPIGNEPEQTVASGSKATASADVKITTPLDVNNMVAVEFTVFPGLYPTIGGKLIKRGPFKSKAEM